MKKVWFLFTLAFSLVLSTFSSFASAKEWELPWIKLITRAQWGADESIRLLSRSKSEIAAENAAKEQARLDQLKKSDPKAYEAEMKKKEVAAAAAAKSAQQTAERGAYMKKYYLNDWSYQYTNDKMGNYRLLYPDQINNNKTKIVVHHTATTYSTAWNEEEIKQALQWIYKYHTIDRDFGDIGYNFLIDHLGNIYEGRAGGEGSVGMHVAYNNVASIGISLLGNFEENKPTQAQVNALTDLLTSLARKYGIDPTAQENYFQPSSTAPYVTVKKLPTIVGHGDIAATACPGKQFSPLLPFIRTEVSKRLNGASPSQVTVPDAATPVKGNTGSSNAPTWTSPTPPSKGGSLDFPSKLKKVQDIPGLLEAVIEIAREGYQGTLPKASNAMNKLAYKRTLEEIRNTSAMQNLAVLLYELSTQYKTYEVKCQDNCLVSALMPNDQFFRVWAFQATFTVVNDKILVQSEQLKLTEATYILIEGEIIEISNYDRKSYAGIPWNTFHGNLIFKQDVYKTLDGTQKTGFVVINQLPFSKYLEGIVETNDQEHLEKNKVMALIAKNYALFYLGKKNIHPSIPAESSYEAIDSAEMFQKYVGAGLEKTLTKRYQALEATKNQVVMWSPDGTTQALSLPILPYFSCSAGFTLSAEEKRGWKDTPYLQSVFDFAPCKDFEGHGVGLAGKGAEFFAQKGMKAEEILQWYYPGVKVVEV